MRATMTKNMRETMTMPTTPRDGTPRVLHLAVCDSCASGAGNLVFGDDPDGFVLCRDCLSPLFYCDIGGQG